MRGPLQQHTARLAVVGAAFVAAIAVYGAIVYLVPPQPGALTQAEPLLWALVAVAALNVVTLTPVLRAMLAGPLRVYAVSQDLDAVLRAHLAAQVVLFARLEAVAIFGLVLYFVTGLRDWFWAFAAVAAAGMVLLWPSEARVKAALSLD